MRGQEYRLGKIGRYTHHTHLSLSAILARTYASLSLPSSFNFNVQTLVGIPGNGLSTTGATSKPCFNVLKVLLPPFPHAAYICGVSEVAPRRLTTLASHIGSREERVSTSRRFWRGRGVKNAYGRTPDSFPFDG